MHVLGIVGSMRKNRHTNTLVGRVIGDMKRIDPIWVLRARERSAKMRYSILLRGVRTWLAC
jgi:hypothetical protein